MLRSAAMTKAIKSSAAAVLAVVAVVVFHQYQAERKRTASTVASPVVSYESEVQAARAAFHQRRKRELAPVPEVSGGFTLATDLQALLDAGEIAAARARLLEQAVAVVETGDQSRLAHILASLGVVSLAESDIDAAEVYLAEALAHYNELDDELGEAGVYLQFGRLHLISRQRARRASDAYDTLLIARWKISQGQFYDAEPALLSVVEDNMALNRFGAAASAWQTLYRGYRVSLDDFRADNAGREAVRLHATSGQIHEARAMLESMRAAGTDAAMLADIEQEIDVLYAEFEHSVKKIGAARDYDMLYNQLQAKGDVVSAWRFRLQADASLAQADSRAMYRRQPDVLVELYKSNDSMDRASESLARARSVFARHGLDDMIEESETLRSRIF